MGWACSVSLGRKREMAVRRPMSLEMANKPVPVGITRTRPRFDGESPF